MDETTLHRQLTGTAFAFCNHTTKLYQQRKHCRSELANRRFTCWVGVYSYQGKCQRERLPGTGLCISCKCHTSCKGNLSPCLSCSPANSRTLLQKNNQNNFLLIQLLAILVFHLWESILYNCQCSHFHLKPSPVCLLTHCNTQNAVTKVSK